MKTKTAWSTLSMNVPTKPVTNSAAALIGMAMVYSKSKTAVHKKQRPPAMAALPNPA